MKPQLFHASVVQIDGKGIMIIGQSGSGKTSTALGLLETAKIHRKDASLICDDQAHLFRENQQLIAKVPEQIAGQVEIRGFGIINHPYLEKSAISLVTELVDDEKIERMPEPDRFTIEGLNLPFLKIPRRHEELAVRIVFAWLNENS